MGTRGGADLKQLIALMERLFDRPIDASKGEQSFYEELCNIFSECTAVALSVYPPQLRSHEAHRHICPLRSARILR